MKKWMLAFGMVMLALTVSAQEGAGKDNKLLQAFNSFSAATLYNTYGIIGSIGDGFGADAYDAETVKNLLEAQKSLMDNLVKVMEELKTSGSVADSVTVNYINSSVSIMKNLKEQARLMIDYSRTKKRQALEAYEKQRNTNWKDISHLMGIPE
ncbi:MAG: hypothetical protein JNM88_16175 [Chitinophagaceae bacterium]|nr:hypothetical protein [Chitinophagaceae bacterium]